MKKHPIVVLINNNFYKIAIGLIIFYFILRSLDTAIHILPYIAPDERYHIDLSVLFSKRIWMVKTEDLGMVGFSRPPKFIPYAYHFIVGKTLWFNFLGFKDYVFLRLINVIISSFTLFYAYKLGQIAFKNKSSRLFSLLILTNIPQFSFLAASVNYDNLVNLSAYASIYYLFGILLDKRSENLIKLSFFILLGTLTKLSFAPLAIILITLLLVTQRRKLLELIKHNYTSIKMGKDRIIFVFVLMLFVLNLQLYARNFVVYKKLIPSCTQIMSLERCQKTKPFQQKDPKNLPKIDERVGYFSYLYTWAKTTSEEVMYHGGHRTLYPPIFVAISFFFVLIACCLVVLLRLNSFDTNFKYLFFITFFYLLYLTFHLYKIVYLPNGLIDRSINGRYIFIVLFPLIVMFTQLIEKVFKKQTLPYVFLGIATFFVYFDYIYFKSNIDYKWTKDWYAHADFELSKKLHYLESNTHTGEPYGWECYYIKCE